LNCGFTVEALEGKLTILTQKMADINNSRVLGETWNAKRPKNVGRSLGQSTDGRKLGVGILEF